MFHIIRVPEIKEVQDNRQADQKRFVQLAHSLEKPIRHELSVFAKLVGFEEDHAGAFPSKRYRLRKETHPGRVTWWIEKDIAPYDRYRCAAYQVDLCLAATGGEKLYFRSGSQKYVIDVSNLPAIHNVFLEAGNDPALIIPRRMGAALDP